MGQLIQIDLGRAAYRPTLELQQRLVRKVQADSSATGYLLLVEHDTPTITLGRRGQDADILADDRQLAEAGAEIVRIRRGGQATYHGPGQLVGYPILPLQKLNLRLRDYVAGLERTLVRVLERFGLTGRPGEHQPGVWVGDGKIAAIGVAVRRWVTWHGCALNVSTDLSHFDWIVPCGQPDSRPTSIAACTGREVSVTQASEVFVECFSEQFSMDINSTTQKNAFTTD